MDVSQKLEALTRAAEFDSCGYSGRTASSNPNSPLRFLYRAALPQGGTVCLFKVLLTNVCVNDCGYCVNRAGRDRPRSAFKSEELARVFMELYNKKLAQGLFLSSGIAGNASRTMESMVNTVEILRRRYEYKGYVHLKILPGASFDCVEAACKLANRVSVNMEAPTAQHLSKLSTRKDIHKDILDRMKWVKNLTANTQGIVPSGQTTQFVVGAAGETDRELLQTTNALYREVGLRRAYFSAFRPVSNSPLEGLPPTPAIREHRLYQADWLLRVYGFALDEVELALGDTSNPSLSKDPKLVIARRQPWLFPVDVNTAGYDELLRVPGIGPVSARRIVETRRDHSISSLEQLKKMGVTRRASPFIWFQGMLASEKQLSFMTELEESQTQLSLAGAIG